MGFLPPVSPDRLEVLTVRGSHTTVGGRLMHFGTKGVHEEM